MPNTHISVLIDRSSDFRSVSQYITNGYNSLLLALKNIENVTISLSLFDVNGYQSVYSFKSISDIQNMDNLKNDSKSVSSLNNSLSRLITDTSKYLPQPDNILFIVLPATLIDASTISNGVISNVISTQINNQKWNFIFAGTNQVVGSSATSHGVTNTIQFLSNEYAIGKCFESIIKSVTNLITNGTI